MSILLMSGNCRIGYAGEETGLIDYSGNELFTGDLVALSAYNDDDPDKYDDFYGIEFVCNNEFQDDGCDKKKFIMGLASEHYEWEEGYESIVYQNHAKWRIKKVKGYEQLVDGEEWGAVRAVYVD